ncbi:MAG: hypothetical protein A2527_04850 [Candidatus Lambdaproteobacteria bacterium RIFOXYD2_FULL_50_16]|uniref:HMA domain-containing protein n=1 Tax=Candidatus Lambdaproteobacteria bacterium RIFOXYD2_FULL_50_16 TaxID=1817772 RepID=A0A1F6GBI1_9PROT|nr:MAG: hypothetical protein A2527_04850 [Candidatus Lambdaproteobacteria bacterium RIFOXYD2_FULL_50_16]
MKEAILEVSEMSCASCSARVEGIVRGLPGVERAAVNLLTEQLSLTYDESQLALDQVIQAVTEGGYPAKEPVKLVNLVFRVEGMSCASCSANLEKGLSELEGMVKASVNLSTEKAALRFDPTKLKSAQIKEKAEALGYPLKEMQANSDDLAHSLAKEKERLALKNKFIGSLALSLPLVIVAMGEMVGLKLPEFVSPHYSPQTFVLTQLLLCLPVMGLGRQFYQRGLKALYHLGPNMDSLIAIGTLASFGHSLWGLALVLGGDSRGFHMLYFESTAVILTLILMGKFLESGAKQKSAEAMKALLKLRPSDARLIDDKGRETLLPIEEVMPGDRLLVKIGERVPLDGVILEGQTALDQSFLTGESMPVELGVGDPVAGASLNQGQPIQIEVTKTAENSTLAQIIKLVEDANAQKAPVARLADQISGVFVPVVMVLATLAGLGWWILGGDFTFGLQVFVAVLVIACPCALGLATPTAILVGVGRGAALGILVKGGESLENSAKLDQIMFDKTGTLTRGKPELLETLVINGDRDGLLALAAGAERQSEHLIAKAICLAAEQAQIAPLALDNVEMVKSLGVQAQYQGQTLKVGHFGFAGQGAEPAEGLKLGEAGITPIYVSLGGQILGILGVADPVKPEAALVMAQLMAQGIEPVMLTGDHPLVAAAIAQKLGIKQVGAGLLPGQKLEWIKQAQAKGLRVAMVGDGINDAPALVQADLGVAIGSGAEVAVQSADFILVKDQLTGLLTALSLARQTLTKIKQNLFWAFCYNSLGIPFAAGILVPFGGPALSPMIAALAMALSSVSVLTNSLTLRLFKPVELEEID